jgi:hypothetical protein
MKAKPTKTKPFGNGPSLYHNGNRMQGNANNCTVCDETNAERCPILPGVTTRLNWSFEDPSSFQGTPEEKLTKTREVREGIKQKIEQWCEEVCSVTPIV